MPMPEKVIQTYLRQRYFISTIYRSTPIEENGKANYYETAVFHIDMEKRQLGNIIESEDSGTDEEKAIYNHLKIAQKYI